MGQQNYAATVTSVAASTSAVTLFALQPDDVSGRMIYNDSSATLYVKFGSGASTTDFTVKIPADTYFEIPGPDPYDGQVTGIWSAAAGSARCTEVG
jgi:hypothetical protein